jgi:hypothetical protein
MIRIVRSVGCVRLELYSRCLLLQNVNEEQCQTRPGIAIPSPHIMTKDQAIHRIQAAISELREFTVIQGTVGRTSADEAITMLEELKGAIQKRQLDQRHAVSVDSSAALPSSQGWR